MIIKRGDFFFFIRTRAVLFLSHVNRSLRYYNLIKKKEFSNRFLYDIMKIFRLHFEIFFFFLYVHSLRIKIKFIRIQSFNYKISQFKIDISYKYSKASLLYRITMTFALRYLYQDPRNATYPYPYPRHQRR